MKILLNLGGSIDDKIWMVLFLFIFILASNLYALENPIFPKSQLGLEQMRFFGEILNDRSLLPPSYELQNKDIDEYFKNNPDVRTKLLTRINKKLVELGQIPLNLNTTKIKPSFTRGIAGSHLIGFQFDDGLFKLCFPCMTGRNHKMFGFVHSGSESYTSISKDKCTPSKFKNSYKDIQDIFKMNFRNALKGDWLLNIGENTFPFKFKAPGRNTNFIDLALCGKYEYSERNPDSDCYTEPDLISSLKFNEDSGCYEGFSTGSNKSMKICSDGYNYYLEYDGKQSKMRDIKSNFESVSFKNGKLNSSYRD